MGKYNELKYLKKTKARVNHQCNQCGVIIIIGDYYYRETEEDRFLQSLHAKGFCTKCYTQFGASLLKKGKGKRGILQNGKGRSANFNLGKFQSEKRSEE